MAVKARNFLFAGMFLLFLLFFSFFGSFGRGFSGEKAQAGQPAGPASLAAKYLIFVVVDGGRTDYWMRFNTPNVMGLAARGVFVDAAQTVFPSNTTTAMTSLITGAYPATHSIPSTTYYDPDTSSRVNGPRHNAAETLAEVFEKAGLSTAAVQYFVLQGRGAKFYFEPNDTVAITDQAVALLEGFSPNLTAIIYNETDSAGHEYGPDSPEIAAAIEKVDRQIGALVGALKETGIFDQTVMVLTADHGMSPIRTNLTPAVEEALKEISEEENLSIAYATDTLGAPRDVPLPNGLELVGYMEDPDVVWLRLFTIAQITFRHPLTPEQEARFGNRLKELPGVAAVLNRDQIQARHGHRNLGDLVVAAAPGYGFTRSPGGHGGPFEQEVPILMEGPGIKKGLRLSGIYRAVPAQGGVLEAADPAASLRIQIVDLVPTLLHLFRLPIPATVDGRILKEVLAGD
ncbi:MAG: alkaline phosphatase family protein [Firmicutes bacterium]|nr:alkaline phosphatase family protein [Bacillota bacterium]